MIFETVGVSILDVGHFQCRTILSGEAEHTVYCGARTTGRLPYCVECLPRYYRKPVPVVAVVKKSVKTSARFGRFGLAKQPR